jgi:hypothetical protein
MTVSRVGDRVIIDRARASRSRPFLRAPRRGDRHHFFASSAPIHVLVDFHPLRREIEFTVWPARARHSHPSPWATSAPIDAGSCWSIARRPGAITAPSSTLTVARRHCAARRARPPDGLHRVRPDWCRRAAGLDTDNGGQRHGRRPPPLGIHSRLPHNSGMAKKPAGARVWEISRIGNAKQLSSAAS